MKLTKREQMKMIVIEKLSSGLKEVYYGDLHCGTYTKSWKASEIRNDVYNELKERGLLM